MQQCIDVTLLVLRYLSLTCSATFLWTAAILLFLTEVGKPSGLGRVLIFSIEFVVRMQTVNEQFSTGWGKSVTQQS